MNAAARHYLEMRGYDDAAIECEPITAVEPGLHRIDGVDVKVGAPSLAFTCASLSGTIAGIHLASYSGAKDYQWRTNPAAPFLPVCYATKGDWLLAWTTREVILVEGVFDRIAVKRALPDRAVVARLSKSVASVQWVLRRCCTRVWLALDRDDQGMRGARVAERRLEGLGLEVGTLTFRAKDPAEHLETWGLRSLKGALETQLLTEL